MKVSRRNFIKGGLALTAASPLSACAKETDNSSVNDSAVNSRTGPKALVGIFLFGGNDAYNMVIPRSTKAYAQYQAARPDIAIDKKQLINTGLKTANGPFGESVAIGLHPAMAALKPIFSRGNANVIVNSGQLVQPLIGKDKNNALYPEFLMAHNLQQTMWQSGAVNMLNRQGWAGRMIDDMNITGLYSPLISTNGDKKWLRSDNHEQMQMSPSGPGDYKGIKAQTFESMTNLWDNSYANLYPDNYGPHMRSRYLENENLKEILSTVDEDKYAYPNSKLGEQLRMVGRLLRSRDQLAQDHQVFMVGIGGFDTHNDQLTNHSALLTQVAEAMAAFQQELDKEGIADQVTTFTMSDFGRRIMANGSGTDHGWAGHQLIMGGAVKGVNQDDFAIGRWPDLSPNSEYDHNKGRLIPEIAADQVNAELAKWFGYPADSIESLFPNLPYFKDEAALNLFR